MNNILASSVIKVDSNRNYQDSLTSGKNTARTVISRN